MHEFGITRTILDIALEKAGEAGAGRINRIDIAVGELSGIVEESVRFYLDFMTKDTMAAGAEVVFHRVTLRLSCRDCGAEFTPQESRWSCPACRGQNIDIMDGRECSVESIEVE